MLSVVDNLSIFINWAQAVMNEKDVTQADIARTGLVTTAAVSKLFTFKVKTVGVEMCKAIAMATGTPLITIYRKAGHLPLITASEVEMEEIVELVAQITDEDLREDAKAQLNIILKKQLARRTPESSTPASKNS